MLGKWKPTWLRWEGLVEVGGAGGGGKAGWRWEGWVEVGRLGGGGRGWVEVGGI